MEFFLFFDSPSVTSLTWEIALNNGHIRAKQWLFYNFAYYKKFFFRIGPLIYLQELTALPIVNKAQWLWRRRFLDFIIVLSLFWYYLDSKCVSSYEQIGIPFTKGCFLLILVIFAHHN